MKRRSFLAALGLAPVLAKLALRGETLKAERAPRPWRFWLEQCSWTDQEVVLSGPPTYNGVPIQYTASLDGGALYGGAPSPHYYAINASALPPRIRWKLQDRQRRIAARRLKASA